MNEKGKNEKPAPDALVEGNGSMLRQAKAIMEKFVNKCDTGRARSVETYAEMTSWLADHKKAVPKQPDALTTIAGIILKDFSGRLPQNIVERLEAALPAEEK